MVTQPASFRHSLRRPSANENAAAAGLLPCPVWLDLHDSAHRDVFERHGDVTVLSSTPGDESAPGNATLLVSGAGAYGLFRGERGLHRFASRLASGRRHSELLRVSVLPEPPQVLPSDESSVSSARARGGGGSWARAVHTHSLQVVEAQNDLDESTNRDLVRRLLAALIVNGEPHPDDDSVVRVYYLDGQQEVRDIRANVRSSRLDLVLSGDLSELVARDA